VELIFGQRLGRVEIDSPGFRLMQETIEHGQVVAERLAAGRGCDDDHVLARLGQLESLDLMSIEPGHVAADESLTEPGGYRWRDVRELGSPGRLMADRADR